MNNKRASNFLLPLSLLHEYNEQSEGVDIDEIKKIIEKEELVGNSVATKFNLSVNLGKN